MLARTLLLVKMSGRLTGPSSYTLALKFIPNNHISENRDLSVLLYLFSKSFEVIACFFERDSRNRWVDGADNFRLAVVLLLAGFLDHPLPPGFPLQRPISRHQGKRKAWVCDVSGGYATITVAFKTNLNIKLKTKSFNPSLQRCL
jgi:hypothetical protein